MADTQGQLQNVLQKLAPNGMVSSFTSLPAAPIAVEETVRVFFSFNFIDLDVIMTEEIIPEKVRQSEPVPKFSV